MAYQTRDDYSIIRAEYYTRDSNLLERVGVFTKKYREVFATA